MKTISEITEYLRDLSKEHYGDTSAIDDIADWIDLRFFYPEMTLEGNAILLNKCRDFIKSHFNDNSFERENTVHDMHSFILDNQFSQVNQSVTKEEPACKEIDFSMEEYKKHPDCLYLRETGAQIKELVHFNSARYSFQYAGTVDGDLHLFMSGNEFILRVPVKKVRKEGWYNVYRDDLYQTRAEAMNHQLVGKDWLATLWYEWTEEE